MTRPLTQSRDRSFELVTTLPSGRQIDTTLHIDAEGKWWLEGEDKLVAAIGRSNYTEWLIDLWSRQEPPGGKTFAFSTEVK
jgi:hypothetical protein